MCSIVGLSAYGAVCNIHIGYKLVCEIPVDGKFMYRKMKE